MMRLLLLLVLTAAPLASGAHEGHRAPAEHASATMDERAYDTIASAPVHCPGGSHDFCSCHGLSCTTPFQPVVAADARRCEPALAFATACIAHSTPHVPSPEHGVGSCSQRLWRSDAASASCGSAFCTINTSWDAHGGWLEPGARLDLRCESIRQDRLDYAVNQDWAVNLLVPLVDRHHEHIHNHGGGQIPESWDSRRLGAAAPIAMSPTGLASRQIV